jgi:methylthioribose-1-phosphate isomerase
MVQIIHQLQVRGAPLIGVAASLCLGLLAEKGEPSSELLLAAEQLRRARPTAVNLMICIDRMKSVITRGGNIDDIVSCAEQIFVEDLALCQRMSELGAAFIESGDNILTHCNTGGLATAGIGTALGVIQEAHKQGKKLHVYVDETRPLLQGGRLTTWELQKLDIPYTLICDNMAGFLMRQGKIQKIFVGADRIAPNGDFANKIGTYSLAVLAKYHNVPFYVVAPYTTMDFSIVSEKEIPIEERPDHEVQGVQGSFGSIRWAPAEASVYNPAFDTTPASLITALISDKGVFDQQKIKYGYLANAQTNNNSKRS